MVNSVMGRKNKDKLELYISKTMKAEIKTTSKSLGITMSELVKRALETYLNK